MKIDKNVEILKPIDEKEILVKKFIKREVKNENF